MSTTQQAKLHSVVPYELGDCLKDTSARGDSTKLILHECPICRTDPTRPRHFFARQAKRPVHFANEHDADEV